MSNPAEDPSCDPSRALRRADTALDALRDEADQLDAMIAYLQRKRDAVEEAWSETLADRDRLESELWQRAMAAVRDESVTVPSDDGLVPEGDRRRRPRGTMPAADRPWPANAQCVPPDVANVKVSRPRSTAAQLDAWGLLEAPAPPCARSTVGVAARWGLEPWDLEEVAAPEPAFFPIAHTRRIHVVPGGMPARPRPTAPRGAAPRAVAAVDTAPMGLARAESWRRMPTGA